MNDNKLLIYAKTQTFSILLAIGVSFTAMHGLRGKMYTPILFVAFVFIGTPS